MSAGLQLETVGHCAATEQHKKQLGLFSSNGLLLRAAPLPSIGNKLFYRCYIKGLVPPPPKMDIINEPGLDLNGCG